MLRFSPFPTDPHFIGWLYVGRQPKNKEHVIPALFNLPDDQPKYASWLRENRDSCNLFYNPLPRTEKDIKSDPTPEAHNFIWADVDWQKVPDTDEGAEVYPRIQNIATYVVTSGTQLHELEMIDVDPNTGDEIYNPITSLPPNYHVYVRLAAPVDAETHHQLNDELRRYLHADSKQNGRSYLRIPDTINHKPDDADRRSVPIEVDPRLSDPNRFQTPESLRSLPGWPATLPVRSRSSAPLDWTPSDPPHQWRAFGRIIWAMSLDEAMCVYGSRHKAVYSTVADLQNKGFNRDQIHTSLDKFIPGRDKEDEEGGYDLHKDIDRALDRLTPTKSSVQQLMSIVEKPKPIKSASGWEHLQLPGVFTDLHECAGGLPWGYVLLSALTTLSAVMPNVSMKRGGSQIWPSLYGLIVGDSGSGKTPAIEIATEQLTDIDSTVLEQWYDERVSLAAEVDPSERNGINRLKKNKLEEHDRSLPYIQVGQATPEGLTKHLSCSQTGSAFLFADEITSITSKWDRYVKSGGDINESPLLEMWNFKSQIITRKMEVVSMAKKPRVTLLGGIQPKYLRKLGDPDKGHQARYLCAYHIAKRVRDRRRWERCASYDLLIADLYASRRAQRVWSYTPDAEKFVGELVDRWEDLRYRAGIPDSDAQFLAKSEMMLDRLCLVLAETYTDNHLTGGDIGEGIVKMAAQVVEASLHSWKACRLTGGDPLDRGENIRVKNLGDLTTYLIKMYENGRSYVTMPELREAKVAGSGGIKHMTKLVREWLIENPGTVWFMPGSGRGGGVTIVCLRPPSLASQTKLHLRPLTLDEIG